MENFDFENLDLIIDNIFGIFGQSSIGIEEKHTPKNKTIVPSSGKKVVHAFHKILSF